MLSLLALLQVACPSPPVSVDSVSADIAVEVGPTDVNADLWGPADCDPLMPSRCALPWPSSHYLTPDATRATGYTLALGATSLPANRDGLHVDPDAWRRMDGFGVGTPMVMYFPDLDPTNLPDETALASSLDADSPILFYALKKGVLERVPVWAELDIQAPEVLGRALIVRPAVILEPATRYVIALRHLQRKTGPPFEPSPAFEALRSGTTAGTSLAARQPRFDELFAALTATGVDVDELVLAWDFVTASHDALHGPMVHMRDVAFEQVGPKGPPLEVDPASGLAFFDQASSPYIALEVRGTMEVPHFLEEVEVAGGNKAWRFHAPQGGVPSLNGTRKAEFRLRIPWSALDGSPHGVMVHGHGQNGTHGQIATEFYDGIAYNEKMLIVGCNMIGASQEDLPAMASVIYDLSAFHTMTDRVHQGMVEHLLLVRAMRERLVDVPELAELGLTLDSEAFFYAGISQGAVYGTTFMALSQDITRGHLGVPGSNFGLLVRRSQNFHEFFAMLHISYSDFVEKTLLLAAVQTLWDTVDPVSYLRHIKVDLLPDTPPHEVLLASATGDRQVALVSNEVMLRSGVGVALMPDYGKEVPLVTPTAFPHQGSGLMNYDFGNPWPPAGPKPPKDDVGDPHEKPRTLHWHNAQMMHFFRTGVIIDVCGGDGCTPH